MGEKQKRKMFISVLPGEQVEVAIMEDGVVVEYYVEMLHQSKTKGNIYKGIKVVGTYTGDEDGAAVTAMLLGLLKDSKE